MNKRILRAVTVLFALVLVALQMGIPASAAVDPTRPSEAIQPGGPTWQADEPQEPSQPPSEPAGGPSSEDPNISININGEGSDSVKIVLLVTIISLLPSILMMMTCFTRIIIVFSLLRNALGLQQTPPNQVMVGLALFLTLFIMRPVITEINETAYQPFSEGTMESQEFLDTATVPLKEFMLRQAKPEDLNMFLSLAGEDRPEDEQEIGMTVVIPSFITSEIKRGFTIGFFVYIPFLIIDMVVASALMSMGMMMLPPVTISLPFKLMLFVLVDGWGLLIKTLVQTFHMGP